MITKLISKICKTNAPIVVGLDPMMKYVPEHIRQLLQSMGRLWRAPQKQSGSLTRGL